MGNIFSELLNSAIVIRIRNGLAGFAWDTALLRVGYVYNLADNLESLQNAVQDVRALRNQLMGRVIVAEQDQTRTLRRSEQAEIWFGRVRSAITKGEELMREHQVPRGFFPANYFSSPVFGGNVVKCSKKLSDLKDEGSKLGEEGLTRDDDAVADQSILGDVKDCDQTVGLEAKLEAVLSCLEKQEVGILGLYGLGGVGKTTLLKKINNHYVTRPSSGFHVVWIDMALHLEMIQEDVLEKFGLLKDWRHESIGEKAEYISKALKQKKFLLLLDGIEKPIDLLEIGVPHPSALNGSKVVFTTRSQDTCDAMKPKPVKNIAIETLTKEAAWELFRMHVGENTLNSHLRIWDFAEILASKCGGLPLALKLIGEAMSGKKEVLQWEHAIQTFERPSKEDEHGIDEVSLILRYSYDNLATETLKSCFLYCALYPKGFRILKTHIVEQWILEEFLIDSDDAEFNGCTIVSALCGACLFEDHGRYIDLHDMVRSMALRIAKEDTLMMAGMMS